MKHSKEMFSLLNAQRLAAYAETSIFEISGEIEDIENIESENSQEIKERTEIIKETLQTIIKAFGLLNCELCDLHGLLEKDKDQDDEDIEKIISSFPQPFNEFLRKLLQDNADE